MAERKKRVKKAHLTCPYCDAEIAELILRPTADLADCTHPC